MRVLVACEMSGRVREAFRKLGHEAWSCDLKPSMDDSVYHHQGDVSNLLEDGWDLLIAHPPCTYLTNAGIGWFNEEKYGDKARQRKLDRQDGADFFMKLYNADVPRICIENPVGWMNKNFRKPDQIIHPYYFSDPHVKGTCLWLRNLPLLQRDLSYQKPSPICTQIRKPGGVNKEGAVKHRYFSDVIPSGKQQAEIRSITFQGIANAMSSQWSVLPTGHLND